MRSQIVCAAALAMATPPASASEPREVEGVDFEAGETEIELETRFNLDQGMDEWELQIQAERGLSSRWSLGGELEFEQDVGARLSLDTVSANLKWRGVLKSNTPVALAASLGGGYAVGDNLPLLESALFAGMSRDNWLLSGRAKAEFLLGRGTELGLTYRARLERELEGELVIGIESSGDILADEAAQHRIGPIMTIELGKESAPEVGIGALLGLNRATPDVQIRAEIEFSF